MSASIEQKIIENAPKGWTHLEHDNIYWMNDAFLQRLFFWRKTRNEWAECRDTDFQPIWSLIRSRKDIEEIIAKDKQIEEIRDFLYHLVAHDCISDVSLHREAEALINKIKGGDS